MNAGEIKLKATVVDQVGKHIRELIVAKGLQPGDALPSYRQLAKDLQVGYTTVKFAMDSMEEQGVVRRQAARGCYVNRKLSRTGRVLNKLGIIFPAARRTLFSSPYLLEILRGISAVDDAFADLHFFNMRHAGRISAAQIAEHGVDGAVLLCVENEEYLRAFSSWQIPGVVVDYHAPNVPLNCVSCDNAAGARRAVQQVLELGHQRVLYVGGPGSSVLLAGNEAAAFRLDSSDAAERRAVACAELKATASVRWESVSLDLATEAHQAQFWAVWDRAESAWSGRPTAVLAYDDSVARIVARELAKRGLRVPEDVSVCALAMPGDARLGNRILTGCRFDFVGMGQQAISLLQGVYQSPGATRVVTHRIGFEFVEGQTVKRAEGSGDR